MIDNGEKRFDDWSALYAHHCELVKQKARQDYLSHRNESVAARFRNFLQTVRMFLPSIELN